MIISHYGRGMVKVQQGEAVVIFNPIGEIKGGPGGVKPVKMGADIALVSLRDEAYNGVANAARGERTPFVVDGPGEYEVNDIFIKGFATAGPGDRTNTAYLVTLEQTRLLHLGALTSEKLPDALAEGAGVVDILFVPVGSPRLHGEGNGTLLTPKQAAQVISDLEPGLVVPVDYDDKTLSIFLKELGAEKESLAESLTIKKKDLVAGQTRVAIVKSY